MENVTYLVIDGSSDRPLTVVENQVLPRVGDIIALVDLSGTDLIKSTYQVEDVIHWCATAVADARVDFTPSRYAVVVGPDPRPGHSGNEQPSWYDDMFSPR